ncbi:MAG: ATP-dependent Clp protease proteolytic subunit [Treponema sp.]|nr:ATP-dependent Clp protease proteolytic subunit [Treponema sp.]MBR4629979.1 ATP-dependent Clp protease proteolytic subunit [Treponema sp.]MBR6913791.1 ATP-dependent Clp protease proteolytic subunit [Treponema sp.]MCR5124324.1 ATP-dependent Clp protease proteolytic subunit [Treponema sp.]
MILNEEEKKDAEKKEDSLSEKFLKTRQILLSGEINEENAEKINKQLLLLEADSDKPIYIYIDSPGGSIDSGFGIYDMIRFINAPVYTIGTGLIASMGSIILLAAPKERRFGLPNSHYLIHQPLIGGVARGVATDLEIQAVEIAKSKDKLVKLIANETGKSEAEVRADCDRDHWLTAEEAAAYGTNGLISKIITKRSDLN